MGYFFCHVCSRQQFVKLKNVFAVLNLCLARCIKVALSCSPGRPGWFCELGSEWGLCDRRMHNEPFQPRLPLRTSEQNNPNGNWSLSVSNGIDLERISGGPLLGFTPQIWLSSDITSICPCSSRRVLTSLLSDVQQTGGVPGQPALRLLLNPRRAVEHLFRQVTWAGRLQQLLDVLVGLFQHRNAIKK